MMDNDFKDETGEDCEMFGDLVDISKDDFENGNVIEFDWKNLVPMMLGFKKPGDFDNYVNGLSKPFISNGV